MDIKRRSSRNDPFNDVIKELGEDSRRDIETDEDEKDTIPDEEFQKTYGNNFRDKILSWPNNKDTRSDPTKIKMKEVVGPNINIKMPKRSYSSNEEKNYFLNKIKSKKKTEVKYN
jgi:hypothetical protein